MFSLNEIKKSILVALWFMFLTFPIMVIKVNTIYKTIEWRWERMLMVGIGAFVLSFVWRYLIKRKEEGIKQADIGEERQTIVQRIMENRNIYYPSLVALAVFVVIFPFVFSMYQTNIMISALIYVMLGLGLNIVIGLAGLLDLGYVAFFAIGAYTMGLLSSPVSPLGTELSFWVALPLALIVAALSTRPASRVPSRHTAVSSPTRRIGPTGLTMGYPSGRENPAGSQGAICFSNTSPRSAPMV